MSELVIYLDLAATEAEPPEQLADRIRKVPEVGTVDVRVEESERSLAGIDIAAITLTLTALGGAVGGAAFLLDRVKELIKNIRGLRQALVETPSGPKPLDSITAADFEER